MDKKIILLDLNYTLAYRKDGKPSYYNEVDKETYRKDLTLKIKDFFVILITVRPAQYKDQTLRRIKKQINYSPNLALFNEWSSSWQAPDIKKQLFNQYVFPVYGKDPNHYLAIESNHKTREMYRSYKIQALPFDSPLLADKLEAFRSGEAWQRDEGVLF